MCAQILVAEDNPISGRVTRDLLVKAGHHVDVVENGLQVLEAVGRCQYDFVLLDCQMPELDGYETVRALRTATQTMHLKVLAMTASVMTGDRELCLQAGMDDHVAKPFTPAELLARVDEWLRRPGRVPSSTWTLPSVTNRALVDVPALEDLLPLDDGGLLRDLALLVHASMRQGLLDLQDAMAREDWLAAARTAHSLKSSVGAVGLLPLAELAGHLEQHARQQNVAQFQDAFATFQSLGATSLLALDEAVAKLLPGL